MLAALALYACALLTHETAILFPLIVAAYVFLIERGPDRQSPEPSRNAGTILTRALAAAGLSAPFFVLAVAYLCARIEVLGLRTAFHWTAPRAIAGLALTSTHYHSAVDYLATMPVVLLTYLEVLAVPGVAGPLHSVHWVTLSAPIVFVSAGILVILAALALVLVLRRPDRRIYLFCAAWSGLALAPALKLNSIWALVQDRYLYAPSFGWSLALALAVVRIAAVGPRARAAVGTAMALILAAYMVTAIRIEHYWHDDATFFEQYVAAEPVGSKSRRAWEAYLHLRLAQDYMRKGRIADFEREFQKYNELSGLGFPPRSGAQSSTGAQSAGAP